MNYKTIFGYAVPSEHGKLLESLIGDGSSALKIVQIGAGYGRLTALWTEILKRENRKYDYVVIDSYADKDEQIAESYCREALANHATAAKLVVKDPIKAASEQADGSLDIVYLDLKPGAHVKAIIQAWLPKLKASGVLCGNNPECCDESEVVFNTQWKYKAKKSKAI